MNTEVMWFTNGNSFILNGQRYAGATVSNRDYMGEPLSARMSAQKAELIVLTKALELRKTRDTESSTHVRGAIYRERGLLLAEEKTIKIKEHFLFLQRALWGPRLETPEKERSSFRWQQWGRLSHPTCCPRHQTPLASDFPGHPKYSKDDITRVRNLPVSQYNER